MQNYPLSQASENVSCRNVYVQSFMNIPKSRVTLEKLSFSQTVIRFIG